MFLNQSSDLNCQKGGDFQAVIISFHRRKYKHAKVQIRHEFINYIRNETQRTQNIFQ